MNYVYLIIAILFLAWTGLSIYYLQAELRESSPDVTSCIVYSVLILCGLGMGIYSLVSAFRKDTHQSNVKKRKSKFRM